MIWVMFIASSHQTGREILLSLRLSIMITLHQLCEISTPLFHNIQCLHVECLHVNRAQFGETNLILLCPPFCFLLLFSVCMASSASSLSRQHNHNEHDGGVRDISGLCRHLQYNLDEQCPNRYMLNNTAVTAVTKSSTLST